MTRDRASEPERNAHTLLIVDDLEENRDLLSRRFKKRGFSVLEAADGQSALSVLKQSAVDLVVLDVMMPGITGLEVLRRIREGTNTLELPVIMATARGESEHVVEAFDLGATDYVTKPIDFEVLHARVLAALRTASAKRRAAAARPGPIGTGSLLAGRYELGEKLGEGGFGEVYRALHRELARPVAIKLLRSLHAGPDAAARFRREGITACRVQHPNALAVLDSGVTEDGTAFLVMELLEGHPLEREMTGTPLTLARCAEVIAPVCDALHAAHLAGIVHRDIKPANIFIHRGALGETPKLLDFGIAKLVGNAAAENHVTVDGWLLGTPAYMAPERFAFQEVDGRADVYSIAVVIQELLTGSLPFDSASGSTSEELMALAMMHLHAQPKPLRQLRADLPIELEQLLLLALSKNPNERPSAAELASGLREAAAAPSLDRNTVEDLEPLPFSARPTDLMDALDVVNAVSTPPKRGAGEE